MSFSDAELDAAVTAISEPGRLSAAQDVVTRLAPGLQTVLAGALHEGGWFDTAHAAAINEALSIDDPDQRLTAIKILLAEETRLSMLVGVAVGFELARELDYAEAGKTTSGTTSDTATDRKDQ